MTINHLSTSNALAYRLWQAAGMITHFVKKPGWILNTNHNH